MAKTVSALLPKTGERLARLGERLRLARLRRRLTAKQVAQRAGMAPMTLRSVERGGAGVTVGAYAAVLQVLGLDQDIDLLAVADPLGRELQDARWSRGRGSPVKQRAPRERRLPAPEIPATPEPPETALEPRERRRVPRPKASGTSDVGWAKAGGFATSRALADLLEPIPARKRR